MAVKDVLHYEDIQAGQTWAYGAYQVTKDEILDYARTFDPQPHHVDEEAAKRSLVGGLCASGWHSCAMFMRMLYDGYLSNVASLGAPGINEVRWMKPVRPGFVLNAKSTCVSRRLMGSRPNVGICQMRHEIFNQHGELLMTMENAQFVGVRDPESAKAAAAAEAVR